MEHEGLNGSEVSFLPKQESRISASSLAGEAGQPRGWPGEGEKKAASHFRVPLTLTLSRQGRGKIERPPFG